MGPENCVKEPRSPAILPPRTEFNSERRHKITADVPESPPDSSSMNSEKPRLRQQSIPGKLQKRNSTEPFRNSGRSLCMHASLRRKNRAGRKKKRKKKRIASGVVAFLPASCCHTPHHTLGRLIFMWRPPSERSLKPRGWSKLPGILPINFYSAEIKNVHSPLSFISVNKSGNTRKKSIDLAFRI